eukprot:13319804-Alexandrium_andersonii.AAC.1
MAPRREELAPARRGGRDEVRAQAELRREDELPVRQRRHANCNGCKVGARAPPACAVKADD